MKVKLIVYLVVTILVIIGLDSININNILITIISSIIYIIVLLLFINKMYKSEKILFN